jgi:SOS-response transcriptional repressor LexA
MPKAAEERTMQPHEDASLEIIDFLETIRGDAIKLPDSVKEYWRTAIKACDAKSPNWNKAAPLCETMSTILGGLRKSEADSRRIEACRGLVAIFLGAIQLGQKAFPTAVHSFRQAASCLTDWDHKALESLTYFGRAVCCRQAEDWAQALEMSQRGLEAISQLPMSDMRPETTRLQGRIQAEIRSIALASIEQVSQVSDARRITRWGCRPCQTIVIPIVGDISDGVGGVADQSVVECVHLDEDHYNGADFGVKMPDDGMKGHGILRGDIILIHRQGVAENGDIVAVVIDTPTESARPLREYHQAYEEPADMQHWFFKVSDRSEKDLVVTQPGANTAAIRKVYDRAYQSGTIRNLPIFYEDAELTIAGKYVGLVRNV